MAGDKGIKVIPLYQAQIEGGCGRTVSDILDSGQIASGKFVVDFEERLKQFIGCRYLTSAAEMSSAITMALFMAGVRPGDEVVASPMACLATNMPILNLFARVVWCDINPSTGGVSTNDLSQLLTKKTKAILVFHWAGNPVDVESVYKIANDRLIPVIEDASEALGAQVGEKMIGNTGADYTVFSFYPNKHLTSIDGAAIAFRDELKFDEGRWLKRYGIHGPSFRLPDGELNPDSDIKVAGWNSYLNNVNAAVGCHQMNHLRTRISKHQENGMFLEEALKDIPNLSVLNRDQFSRSAYWVFTFQCDRRDELASYMRGQGIQASKVHLRNDLYSCFGELERKLPGVDEFCRRSLSIPCGWWVTEIQLEQIAAAIRGFY